ncbi:MAG: hypothetical protein AAGC77_06375 [Pseudomonadota bacterium]
MGETSEIEENKPQQSNAINTSTARDLIEIVGSSSMPLRNSVGQPTLREVATAIDITDNNREDNDDENNIGARHREGPSRFKC